MPQSFIFNITESYIFRQISIFFSDMKEVQPLQSAWIDLNLAKIDRECPMIKPSSIWLTEHARQVQSFLSMGVQCEIRELIQRSIAMWSDEDIRENNELVSGQCEEIALYLSSVSLSSDSQST
jgi:hypothetical protein